MSNINHNPLVTQDFKLVIPGLETVNLFIQRTALPSMAMPHVPGGFMNNQFAIAGETIIYEPLNVDIIVDENLANYDSIQNWMISNHDKSNPSSRDRDIILHIPTRNSTENAKYIFYGAMPTDLSSLQFDSTLVDVDVQICSITFSYQYYRKVI